MLHLFWINIGEDISTSKGECQKLRISAQKFPKYKEFQWLEVLDRLKMGVKLIKIP